MRELSYDAAVIGGGAAGMAAALELRAAGLSCVVLEREDSLGGILLQCVHNGFGLIEFEEELSGPEFAERMEERFRASGADVFLGVTVMDVEDQGDRKVLFGYSSEHGILRVSARAVILAMGCRERNRGNIRIPGSRPSGVYTAGLAQRLVNMEGYLPGKDVVIIGSGDIGLIMARRMSWAGAQVHAVVEILPYPSGLTRNIVQCLHDFDIPLYLSHLTAGIFGGDRVEAVEIAPIENGAVRFEKSLPHTLRYGSPVRGPGAGERAVQEDGRGAQPDDQRTLDGFHDDDKRFRGFRGGKRPPRARSGGLCGRGGAAGGSRLRPVDTG